MSKKIEKMLSARWYLLGIFVALAAVMGVPALAAAADPAGTVPVIFGTTYSGTHSGSTDIYYKVVVTSPGAIKVSGRASGTSAGRFHIRVLDSASKDITLLHCSQEFDEYVINDTVYFNTGTYYFDVTSFVDGMGYFSGTYDYSSLKFTFSSAGESFPEPEGGSNNSFRTASGIVLNKSYIGMFPTGPVSLDGYDIFKFTVPYSSTKAVISTKSAAFVGTGSPVYGSAIRANIYDKDGNKLGSTSLNFDAMNYRAPDWEWTFLPGTYYLSYEKDSYVSFGGSYSFSFNCVPIAPKFKSKTNGVGYTKLTWNKISGVSGYYIYRRLPGKSFAKIATVKGASTLSYSDKTVTSGTGYYYAVRAYYGSTLSGPGYSSTYIRYLSRPKLGSAKRYKAGYNNIKVTWTGSKNADGYYVYRKTTGGWKKVASVGASKRSWVDTSTKKGVKYTYTVRSWDKTGNYTSLSAYNTTGVSFKP